MRHGSFFKLPPSPVKTTVFCCALAVHTAEGEREDAAKEVRGETMSETEVEERVRALRTGGFSFLPRSDTSFFWPQRRGVTPEVPRLARVVTATSSRWER